MVKERAKINKTGMKNHPKYSHPYSVTTRKVINWANSKFNESYN